MGRAPSSESEEGNFLKRKKPKFLGFGLISLLHSFLLLVQTNRFVSCLGMIRSQGVLTEFVALLRHKLSRGGGESNRQGHEERKIR